MSARLRFNPVLGIFFLSLVFIPCRTLRGGAAAPEVSGTFQSDGKGARLTLLQTLPYVQNEYTKRFKFDSTANPKLKELRTRYNLEDVVAAGASEFDKQVLLMDWVHNRFKKFGRPSTNAKGALDILDGIEQGQSFFCTQYAQLLASSAASLGWVDRTLALRRHQGVNARGGSTEHSTTEIWSNEHRKWVMLDPTSNMYLEKNGVPLNAYEIRQEWFYNSGKELVFVIGKEKQRYRKSDLPIYLKRFVDFGDLTVDPDELDKYGFIGYIPNTDLMDSGFDYGKMFITQDQLCAGTKWHTRPQPANPAVDPYFPIGQVAVTFRPEQDSLAVHLQTLTPNFKDYQVRIGTGGWEKCGDKVEWKLLPGTNRIEFRTVNLFGVYGPTTTAEVQREP